MEAILSDMVPFAFFAMVILLVVIPLWVRTHYQSQDRKRLHETVRLMVEKGQPVSSEMLESLNSPSTASSVTSAQRSGSAGDIRRGVILMMVGLGLAALGAALGPVSDWYAFGPIAGAGAFPGFIGLGFVIIGLLNRSKPKA